MKHSTVVAIAKSQTQYFLENKMITTHDTIGGMSSMNTDDMSARFKIGGFYDEDGEWNSFARYDCCDEEYLIEVGLWNEVEDKSITGISHTGRVMHLLPMEGDISQNEKHIDMYRYESMHGEEIVDEGMELELTSIPIELREYKCLKCGEVYGHAEVRMVGSFYHDYKKYDTVELETPIEYQNPECNPNIHEKAGYNDEITTADEERIDGSIWNVTQSYEPGTKLSTESLKVLKDFGFQARIGNGIEFLNRNINTLDADKVDTERLYIIARQFTKYPNRKDMTIVNGKRIITIYMKGEDKKESMSWSKIRLAFMAARNSTEYSDMGITYKQLFPELTPNCPWLPLESSGYYQCNVLAPKYVKPHNAIYRKRNTDPTPTTPAPKGGKVQAIQELMALTGIYTNAMRTFYINNFSIKKYIVVDFYKALSNAKEGTIIAFKYADGKFEEPIKKSFMSNLDVVDANKKGLALCDKMIADAKALGYITMFRDMDAICLAEFHKEASRIAVRSIWTNIEKYARLVKQTKFACLV